MSPGKFVILFAMVCMVSLATTHVSGSENKLRKLQRLPEPVRATLQQHGGVVRTVKKIDSHETSAQNLYEANIHWHNQRLCLRIASDGHIVSVRENPHGLWGYGSED